MKKFIRLLIASAIPGQLPHIQRLLLQLKKGGLCTAQSPSLSEYFQTRTGIEIRSVQQKAS